MTLKQTIKDIYDLVGVEFNIDNKLSRISAFNQIEDIPQSFKVLWLFYVYDLLNEEEETLQDKLESLQ